MGSAGIWECGKVEKICLLPSSLNIHPLNRLNLVSCFVAELPSAEESLLNKSLNYRMEVERQRQNRISCQQQSTF